MSCFEAATADQSRHGKFLALIIHIIINKRHRVVPSYDDMLFDYELCSDVLSRDWIDDWVYCKYNYGVGWIVRNYNTDSIVWSRPSDRSTEVWRVNLEIGVPLEDECEFQISLQWNNETVKCPNTEWLIDRFERIDPTAVIDCDRAFHPMFDRLDRIIIRPVGTNRCDWIKQHFPPMIWPCFDSKNRGDEIPPDPRSTHVIARFFVLDRLDDRHDGGIDFDTLHVQTIIDSCNEWMTGSTKNTVKWMRPLELILMRWIVSPMYRMRFATKPITSELRA